MELFSAPEGHYKQDIYLLPKKMGTPSLAHMPLLSQGPLCLVASAHIPTSASVCLR